jgi:aminopeptidase N
MVGWSSYHDQWLSEGFADFSAALFLQATQKTPDRFLKFWDTSKQHLLEKNKFGRRANDAGPIWIGIRLDSEKNPSAYDRVVYNKGAYVLHMLRILMQDQQGSDKLFREMMQDFVRQYMNRNASTEDFQHVVEQHMSPVMNAAGNGKMDWFFSEWVYGTAIPHYKLDYTVSDNADGKFLLKGSLAQSEVPESFIMQVPVYLDFDGQLVRFARIRLLGAKQVPFEVNLPKKPKRVFLNAMRDVLDQ